MTCTASDVSIPGSPPALRRLADLCDALAASTDAAALRRTLDERLPGLLGCDRATLALLDAKSGTLVAGPDDTTEITEPALTRCLQERRILSLAQGASQTDTATGSVLAAPLIASGTALGALAAISDATDAFTESDYELIRSVAATVAMVVLACLDRGSDLASARDESRRLHDELNAALHAIPHPVVIYDKDFNFRAWNTAFVEIQGYTHEMMRRFGGMAGLIRYEVEELKSFADQTFEEVYQQYLDYYKFHDFNQSTQYWPMRAKHIDRRTRRTASGGWVSVLVDVTDWVNAREEIRQAKEEAESAARAKSEFLANMSHEIRTPLNAIIGFTQLVLQSTLTDKQRDHLTRVESSSQLLLRILDDILDFSRIDAGMLQLEQVEFDLDEVLGNVVDLTANRIKSSDVELLLTIEDEVPERLIGDPLRLAQILLNLGSNAAKFTSSGVIVIRARLLATDPGFATLRLEVTDTGIGMTREQTDRLFQAFSQADTSTTRRYGGSGLGLAISKALTEMMGGQIGVDSTKDEGSTFHLTLRLGLPTGDAAGRQPRPRGVGWLRALVVDDAQIVRETLLRSMTQLGVAASVAGDVTAAETAIRADEPPYDVVLLDHGLAEPETIDRLRSALLERPSSWDDPVQRKLILLAGPRPEGEARSDVAPLTDEAVPKAATPSRMRDALMSTFGRRPLHDGSGPAIDPVIREALAGLHVLVAEDNEVNQVVAREVLELVGARVTIAENGRRAVEILHGGPHDAFGAVLMDLQMPELDGLSAARMIRQNPAYLDLPIVAMTANAFDEHRKRSREAGMVDHVAKPVDPQQLYEVLIRHTRRRPA